jgi:hypothetical protein
MSDPSNNPDPEIGTSNVIVFAPVNRPSRHEPPLTDLELQAIRHMLLGFNAVATTCPAALRVLKDHGLA